MPQVGNRAFAYGKKGEKQAAAFAKKTGQKVTVKTAAKKSK
jgi:hypothetical protein